jgi:hypothetical protein
MMSNVELIAALAGSSVLGAIVTAVSSRSPSMLREFTKSYTEVLDRVATLEARVDTLSDALGLERKEHGKTRGLLAIARHALRTIMNWDRAGREGPLPEPPAEVLAGE